MRNFIMFDRLTFCNIITYIIPFYCKNITKTAPKDGCTKGRIPLFKKIALATLAAVCVSIATPALASDYLGNPKSMKFHYSNCSTIKHPERFVEFSTRDDAIAAGYVPCKRCNP